MYEAATRPAHSRLTRDLWLVFAIALLVRTVNTIWLSATPQMFFVEDSPIYWDDAAAMAEHLAFVRSTDAGPLPETERMPLYIAMTALVRTLSGDSVQAVIAVQAVIDALSCVVIALLGRLVSARTGLICGVLAALWPNMIIHAGQLLTDSTFALFVALSGLTFAAVCKHVSAWRALALGLCLALAIFTRAAAQFAPLVVVPIVIFITWRQRGSLGRALVYGVVMCIPLAVLMGPIAARNIALYDTTSLTSQGGTHLLLWVVPRVWRDSRGVPIDKTLRRVDDAANALIAAEEQRSGAQNPYVRSQIRMQVALDELRAVGWAGVAFSWSLGALRTLASPALLIDTRIRALSTQSLFATHGNSWLERVRAFVGNNSGAYQKWALAGLAGAALAALLQLAGGLLLLVRHPWVALGAAAVILYFLVLNGPVGNAKYRLPMEPALILFTAVALDWLWQRLRERRTAT